MAPAAPQALSIPTYVNSANSSAVPVSGTAEAGGTVTVTDAGAVHTVSGTATASGTGAWSLNLNLGTLNDGKASYAVTVKDAAGNSSSTATVTDTKDTAAPVLSITAPMYVNLSNYIAVPVSGTTDTSGTLSITARSGLTSMATKQIAVSGPTWSTSIDLTPLDQGSVTFTVSLTDAAGNTGTASAASSTTKDTERPTVAGIVLANGGTQGTADAGDTLTILYSEPLDPAKICSTWTSKGMQTLSGNNDVTVTFNHTSSANTMTVASKTCTLNIGTMSLAANANYASTTSPVVFVGANASLSSVSWDPDASSLTIRLGGTKNNTGAQGTGIGQNVPSYTPISSLADVAGNSFASPITTFNSSPASGF
ncbi:Ig-like domain-containing protein [Pseudarthrobacter phenanthrenivorans]|uniref:Ig-like domain-containing protein n=1 Tax=Pseudarthrobacter phenanthrenivorans TaxID=361575 RepID=UPI00344B9E57